MLKGVGAGERVAEKVSYATKSAIVTVLFVVARMNGEHATSL